MRWESSPVSFGCFDGQSMFRVSGNIALQAVRLLWRYGFDFLRLVNYVRNYFKKIHTIYGLQDSGKAYTTVEDMLAAMRLGNLMKVSIHDYMRNDLRLNSTLVDEFVSSLVRLNYGQATSVNAFVGTMAVATIQHLWRVVGGNHQIAECVLKDSYSSLVMEDVTSVTKTEEGGSVKYTIVTADGKIDEGYDVVIVANPLNTSSIKYDNFSNEVYTGGAITPYQQFSVNFCKGKINQQFFGEKVDTLDFPKAIFTTAASLPCNFLCIGAVVPSDVRQNEVWRYRVPLHEDPVRVWHVTSLEPLTRDQCLSFFREADPDDMVSHDWLAFPQYIPPYKAPSFVLDDGVFYINAIEMAASAMEITAIGAKNAALLARNYLMQRKA